MARATHIEWVLLSPFKDRYYWRSGQTRNGIRRQPLVVEQAAAPCKSLSTILRRVIIYFIYPSNSRNYNCGSVQYLANKQVFEGGGRWGRQTLTIYFYYLERAIVETGMEWHCPGTACDWDWHSNRMRRRLIVLSGDNNINTFPRIACVSNCARTDGRDSRRTQPRTTRAVEYRRRALRTLYLNATTTTTTASYIAHASDLNILHCTASLLLGHNHQQQHHVREIDGWMEFQVVIRVISIGMCDNLWFDANRLIHS